MPSSIISSNIRLYADDAQLFAEVDHDPYSLQQFIGTLQTDINSLTRWMDVNGFAVNPRKTQLLVLSNRTPPNIVVSVKNEAIHPTTSIKNLGVVLDRRLNFDAHVQKTVNTCRQILSQIAWAAADLPRPVVRLAVESLVLSRLFYASCVWRSIGLTR